MLAEDKKKLDRAELLAATCYSAWYAYSVYGLGEPRDTWFGAPEPLKKRMMGVVAYWDKVCEEIFQKQKTITFSELVFSLAHMTHDEWKRSMVNSGWRYGKQKSVPERVHPYLIPYEELPNEQKEKNEVLCQAYLTVSRVMENRE